MPIPQVRVISKQIIARPVQASGLTGLLLIQSERGPSVPTLVSNITEFMSKYTETGEIPESATNRSAYYSAQNFLRDSDRLWVRRVLPEGAMYAAATFQQESSVKEVIITGSPNNVDNNAIEELANSIGSTGDSVTVYGSDLPTGLTNGGRYFLRQVFDDVNNNYDISFYTSEQGAIEAVSEELVEMTTNTGSGTLYMMLTEAPEENGLDDPEGTVAIDPVAFVLHSTDQGPWGNNVRVTVEVPRLAESSIHCADAVDEAEGSFPISVPWIEDNHPGLPIHIIPVGSTSTLPIANGNDQLVGTEVYYAVSSDSGARMKLALSYDDSLVPTTVAFDASNGSKGSGSMLVALIGTIATVPVSGVTAEPNARMTTRIFGTVTAFTVPLATPVACVLYGTLPSPLQQGVVYWAYGGGTSKVRLATSYANALSGSGISVAVSNTSAFEILFFTYDQTVARATGVHDCTQEATAFDCDTAVDETDDTIAVSSTDYALLTPESPATRVPVFFTQVAGTSLPGITAGTIYYAEQIAGDPDYTISLFSAATGGTALPLTKTGGDPGDNTAKFNISGTSYIKSNQRFETGTPVKISLPVTNGAVPLANAVTIDTDTIYYAIEDPVITYPFQFKLATKELSGSFTEIDFVGNAAAAAKNFQVLPVNTYDTWSSGTETYTTYDVVDLDGAVVYGGVNAKSTIQLGLHDGAYQGWVPGESVRVYASGTGSVLPYGLSASATYYILPLGEGKVQICTKSGGALESADQLIPVILSTESNKKGAGYINIVTANSPLSAGSFRLKIWKRTEQTSTISGQSAYSITLEETYECSLYATLTDSAGRNLELSRRLASSKYVRGIGVDVSTNPNVLIKAVPMLTVLGGGYAGANDGVISSTDLVDSLAEFSDTSQYNLSYLMDGGYTYADYQIALISLAEGREDCIAVLSTPVELEDDANPARAIIDYVQSNLPSTSFGSVFTPWQLMTQNGVDILVPPDGFVAAQMSRVDSTKGPWFAAAGLEDGPIRSRGGSVTFSTANLDELYENRVNPIIRISDAGPTIWGNITLLAVQSPLSRINVRKLMNKIQSELRRSLLQFVMAPIDASTYLRIKLLVESYLASIQSKRGIEESLVVCDDSNNTAEDRDALRINVWVYVKPTQVAEFIDLTTVVTPSSVEFSTVVGTV